MSHIYDINNPEARKPDNEKIRDRNQVSDKEKLPAPEKKADNTKVSNKNDVPDSNKRKLEPRSAPEDRYSKMSDKDFDKYIKSLDKNTAPNNLIDDGNGKRNKSPFVNQEDHDFNPDAWGNKALKKGDKIYSIGPENGHDSPYYTDRKTVDSCRRKDGSVDKDKLKQKLQINDPDNQKNTLREYDVNKDFVTGSGKAKENEQYGKGGGNQFFIKDEDKNNLSKGNKIG